MPGMRVSVPHNLGKQEALARIKNLLGELKSQYGDQIQNLQENWSGNRGTFSFSAMGFSVSGELVVEDRQVRLNGNLPLAALPLKGRIEGIIREEIAELLR